MRAALPLATRLSVPPHAASRTPSVAAMATVKARFPVTQSASKASGVDAKGKQPAHVLSAAGACTYAA